ncbi:SDR family oxidoreductase [bacterium AH-315-E10]|nr:SDR family oxidoreductase [bacterium AH-315-E10]
MDELKGKKAFITGAADGIGLGIADVFQREGAELVLFDVDQELLESRREQFPDALMIQGDCANMDDLERAVKDATAGGPVTSLINNAGVGSYNGCVDELSLDEWDRVMSVNLKGSWYLCKLFIPVMRKNGGGTIVFIGSVHEQVTFARHFPYNVTKGGIGMLTKSLALDYGKDNIRSVSISPGWVRTVNNERFLASVENPEETWQKVKDTHPLGRIGEPQEIGEMASFICSDRCCFLNGTSVIVDGGLTASMPG